jgi:hypothetical protein
MVTGKSGNSMLVAVNVPVRKVQSPHRGRAPGPRRRAQGEQRRVPNAPYAIAARSARSSSRERAPAWLRSDGHTTGCVPATAARRCGSRRAQGNEAPSARGAARAVRTPKTTCRRPSLPPSMCARTSAGPAASAPAPRGLGMGEPRLHRTDGTRDRTVADQRLALELGRYREDEGITIGRAQAGGGVGNGKKLRRRQQDRHGRARGCARERSARC